jgi:hypothetical protein
VHFLGANALLAGVTLFAAGSEGQWVDIIERGGVIGMFVLLTWAVLTKRLVPGWAYSAMERDRDLYRDLALKGANVTEHLAERLGIVTGMMEDLRQVLREQTRLRRNADELDR